MKLSHIKKYVDVQMSHFFVAFYAGRDTRGGWDPPQFDKSKRTSKTIKRRDQYEKNRCKAEQKLKRTSKYDQKPVFSILKRKKRQIFGP